METTISHDGHRNRLHKRIFNNGFDNMPEHVILEYMLTFVLPRQDVNPMAHYLIDKFGCIRNIVTASSEELMATKGIKEATTNFLHLFAHLMGFEVRNHTGQPILLNTTLKLAEFVTPLLQGSTFEKLIVVYLDENYNLIEYAKFDGEKSFVNLDISCIINQMSMLQAKAIAIAHNHPSGMVLPSMDDRALTQHFVTLTCTSNIQLMDHIITAEDCFYSFRSNGELEKCIRQTIKILPTAQVKYLSFHPLPDNKDEISDIEEDDAPKSKITSVRYNGDIEEVLKQEREGKVRLEIGKNGVVQVIKLEQSNEKQLSKEYANNEKSNIEEYNKDKYNKQKYNKEKFRKDNFKKLANHIEHTKNSNGFMDVNTLMDEFLSKKKAK